MSSLKTITIEHNGFHGLCTVRIQVPTDVKPGSDVEVSRSVARRVNNKVCGISDCRCGEKLAHLENPFDNQGRWFVSIPSPEGAEVRGHYPQNV